MKKTALVISGGGSKGAFAIGAIEHLMELGIEFDIFVGTSTGALIAPMLATDHFETVKHIYQNVHTKDLLKRHWWITMPWRRSIYSTRGLKNIIDRLLTPGIYSDLLSLELREDKLVLICTTNLNTGGTHYWSPHDAPNREAYVDCLLASCNQPGLMPPVKLRGNEWHVDGGVKEIAPIQAAIDAGATNIYAIVLDVDRPSYIPDEYKRIPQILLRALDLMFYEIRENDISIVEEECCKAICERKLVLIRPEESLMTDGLTFVPEQMQSMMRTGYEQAKEVMREESHE